MGARDRPDARVRGRISKESLGVEDTCQDVTGGCPEPINQSTGCDTGRMGDQLDDLTVPDAPAWRAWLDRHHGQPVGVWLVLAKDATMAPTSLTYDEALEEALSYGWVDGQLRRGDEATYQRRFAPRRGRSSWSKRNVEIVTRLVAEGRMHPAGSAEVERAKADGRWDTAYAGMASIEVPEDFATALASEPPAQAMFDTLNSQNRYSLLYRIGNARRAETRVKRIEAFVAMLARGETLHPQRKRTPPG
jgi:uncharacterized protein YdeI (YjbR/CyaY-like superfamily)